MGIVGLVSICVLGTVLLILPTEGYNNAPKEQSWEAFKSFHMKIYPSSTHEGKAKKNFQKNVDRINAHNARHAAGLESYSLELNRYSDEDPKDFHKSRHGLNVPEGFKEKVHLNAMRGRRRTTTRRSRTTKPPAGDSFDWRQQGKVSPVRNQGQCGSCWAFSAIGALEAQQLITKSTNDDLSEQQVVDCDTNDSGCNGGWPSNAFSYLAQAGSDSESDYPYTASDGTCNADSNSAVQSVSSHEELSMPTDDNTLMQFLKQHGPLSIAVRAEDWDGQYSSGVVSCSNDDLDHAVVLVGYGTDSSQGPYWIIKNSWGEGWGEKGYIRLARGSGKDCGVAKWLAVYPKI